MSTPETCAFCMDLTPRRFCLRKGRLTWWHVDPYDPDMVRLCQTPPETTRADILQAVRGDP